MGLLSISGDFQNSRIEYGGFYLKLENLTLKMDQIAKCISSSKNKKFPLFIVYYPLEEHALQNVCSRILMKKI
jgi:hypothetical protein